MIGIGCALLPKWRRSWGQIWPTFFVFGRYSAASAQLVLASALNECTQACLRRPLRPSAHKPAQADAQIRTCPRALACSALSEAIESAAVAKTRPLLPPTAARPTHSLASLTVTLSALCQRHSSVGESLLSRDRAGLGGIAPRPPRPAGEAPAVEVGGRSAAVALANQSGVVQVRP